MLPALEIALRSSAQTWSSLRHLRLRLCAMAVAMLGHHQQLLHLQMAKVMAKAVAHKEQEKVEAKVKMVVLAPQVLAWVGPIHALPR